MNHGDIKLVIDQLHGMELDPDTDAVVIFNTVNLLEGLGNKVAQQAAVIEKLQSVLQFYMDNGICEPLYYKAKEVLAIPTDSKQILVDWMREQLGQPVGVFYKGHGGEGWRESHDPAFKVNHTPLFKLPKCLK